MAKRKSAGRSGGAARAAEAAAAAAWGEPPRGAAQRPAADLARRLRQRSDARRGRHAETARRLQALRAPLFAPLAKDRAGVAAGVKDLRAVVAGRGFRRPAVPTFPGGVEAGVRSGSILTIRVPPYDAPFMWNHGTPADVKADANAGTFSFAISGGGGSTAASAGVGLWFRSQVDNPSTRVAALTDYDFDWFDISSGGYTAHNDADVRLWVWGDTEQAWVARQPETPAWSDGTGWYEEHSDRDDGRVSNQAFFPARPNAWYMAWLWAAGSVDDNSGGWFGFSWAQAQLAVSVPFIVFEQ